MLRRLPLLGLVSLVLAACSEDSRDSVLGLDPDFSRQRAGPGALSTLSWNVYYGADLDLLLEEGTEPLPVRVARVFGQVQATDAPSRAGAMADLIAASRPHLVGLQEVARYRVQPEGDFLDEEGNVANPVPNADVEVFDFLDLLVNSLADRGLDYEVASRTTTFDVELPMFSGGACPPCSDLRLTESVAVLARADLETTDPDGAVFQNNLEVSVEGFPLEITKGWASVDARLKDRTYRFITAHLEPADILPNHEIHPDVHLLQLAQAGEVLSIAENSEIPVILTGDLNSEPDGGSTDTYALMEEAGFVDTWLVGRRRGEGVTANQDADLLNPTSQLWHRIDFVLYRDDGTAAGGPFRGAVHAERLGEEQKDRTSSGLWPSDHAGVLSVLNSSQEPM